MELLVLQKFGEDISQGMMRSEIIEMKIYEHLYHHFMTTISFRGWVSV
jgi:hypothetical protein